jgi:succinate-acetate transporter protein
MGNDFFRYLQRLELIAFFSGYPLLYAVTLFFAGNLPSKNNFKKRIVGSLTFAYALVGTLYLGLQLKNLYPDYSIENIRHTILQPYLTIWGLLSIFFWIPSLSKKPVLSLLHSLVFFFFLLKDLFAQLSASSADKSIIRNDMKLYTDSLLLNLGVFAFIVLISFLFTYYKKGSRS